MSGKKSALRRKSLIYLLAAAACLVSGYILIYAGTSVTVIGFIFVAMIILTLVGIGYLIGSFTASG
jgi:hypothetical protein